MAPMFDPGVPDKERAALARLMEDAAKEREAIVKFLTMVNAGGLIATLSFAGATLSKMGLASKWILLPAGSFALGLIAIALVLFIVHAETAYMMAARLPLANILVSAPRRILGFQIALSPNEARDRLSGKSTALLLLSLALFLVGVTSGLLVLLCL